MNRAAALAYLNAQYGASTSPYLVMAGIALTDTSTLATIIDDALLALGVDYASLATAAPSNVRGYRATLRYMALRTCWANLNQMALIGRVAAGAGVSVDSVDWRKSIPQQMAEAWADASANDVDLPALAGMDDGWGGMDGTLGQVGYALNYLGAE